MKIVLTLLAIYLTLMLTASALYTSYKRLHDMPKFKIYEGKNGQPYYRYPTTSNPENEVLKGEYICGDKICILEPDVEPQGCGGTCQYPVKYH